MVSVFFSVVCYYEITSISILCFSSSNDNVLLYHCCEEYACTLKTKYVIVSKKIMVSEVSEVIFFIPIVVKGFNVRTWDYFF